MLFKDIPGLQDLKDRLISAVQQNQVAHAQLFSGDPGSPNLAMAIAFATYLNCENKQPEGPCGICVSCVKAIKFIHPDIHFIFPVCSTKEIKAADAKSVAFLKPWRAFLSDNPYGTIEEWTEAFGGQDKQAFIAVHESREIIKSLSLKAFEGEYKITIIWLPELMNQASGNALLKILEEPPEKTLLILVTDHVDNILTTITSRTQTIYVRKFYDDEIRSYLNKKMGIPESKADRISLLADGNLHYALTLSENIENTTHEWFREWMRLCFKKDLGQLVKLSDDFNSMNKVQRKSVFQYGISMIRESLMSTVAPDLGRVEGDEKAFVRNFSKVVDINKVNTIYEAISSSMFHLERNANARIKFLNLSITISSIFNTN